MGRKTKYTILKSFENVAVEKSDVSDDIDVDDELLRSDSYRADFSKRWNEATKRVKKFCVTVKKPDNGIYRCSSGLVYRGKRKGNKNNG